MSDELIQIPSFLANRATIMAAAKAACSWCSEIACESSSMNDCSRGCQTACEGSCQTGCERSCQTACQTGCLSCQTMSQCYEVCRDACEFSCQSCQSGCQFACENSCQGMQGGCYGLCEDSYQQTINSKPTASGTMTALTVGDTVIKVGFSTISLATRYEIVWRLAHTTEGGIGTNWDILGSKTVTSSPCEIDGLKPNTKYAINYKGVNDWGDGPFMASPLIVTTTANGSAYIHDGTGWKLATVYVHNGRTWEQSTPQVHDGTQFLP